MIILSEFLFSLFDILINFLFFRRSSLLCAILFGSIDQIRDRLSASTQAEDS